MPPAVSCQGIISSLLASVRPRTPYPRVAIVYRVSRWMQHRNLNPLRPPALPRPLSQTRNPAFAAERTVGQRLIAIRPGFVSLQGVGCVLRTFCVGIGGGFTVRSVLTVCNACWAEAGRDVGARPGGGVPTTTRCSFSELGALWVPPNAQLPNHPSTPVCTMSI